MSTIAFDGKQLVTDSSVSIDETISQTQFRKIFTPIDDNEYWEINGVRALAFAAFSLPIINLELRKALQKGLNEGDDSSCFSENFDAIVIDETGLAYQIVAVWVAYGDDRKLRISFIPTTGIVAIGTGDQYALAVMAVGKSARSAIKAAIALNVDSAGNLQSFEVPPKPETPSKRPPADTTTEAGKWIDVGQLDPVVKL
jgi:hypothetical protein